jgi:hypothetical protein
MAIEDKKYTPIHDKTDGDKVKLKNEFDGGHVTRLATNPEKEPLLAGLVYQIGLLQDEIDYLRTEISANRDKVTFPGFGTSSSTALAGDTTVISSDQASAIIANTAKVSLVGGKGTALSFSEMITTPPPKGSKTPTYSIVMTAVESGVEKSVTLTLT